jgi:hypothetical protein
MMQSWIGQRMAEEHRRDLTASTRTAIRWVAEGPDPDLMAATSVDADLGHHVVLRDTWDESMPRRAIAPSVGALLIRMGTRLGGASMRTS